MKGSRGNRVRIRVAADTVGRLTVAALMLVTLAACMSVTPVASPSPGAATWPSNTAYGQLFGKVGADGTVSKELALEAFSTVIAPLPGVPAATGASPNDFERASGTFAVRWLLQYYDELTPEQRAEVDKVLTPSASAIDIPPVSAVAAVGAGFPAQPAVVADARSQPYVDAVKRAEAMIAGRLGRTLQAHIWFDFETAPPKTNPNAGDTLAFAYPNGMAGPNLWCGVSATPALEGSSQTRINVAMAHEVFHCFQFEALPNHGRSGGLSWIVEGQAEWAGEDIAGPGQDGRDWWGSWRDSPGLSLFVRTYDAVGFYEHLKEVGINPWSKFDAMLAAPYDSTAAFQASGAVADSFLDTWGSGLMRVTGLPDAWYAHERWGVMGPAPSKSRTLGVGDKLTINADHVTTQQWFVTAQAEIIELQSEGHVRMHSGNLEIAVLPKLMYLCTMTGPNACKCPEGYDYNGPELQPGDATVFLGVTGSLAVTQGFALGHELKEFCEPRPSNKPVPSPRGGKDPCAKGCAQSIGDPHLTTIEEQEYDFQAAGEYTLLRSADGSIEMQARQVPYPDVPDASITTALAWRVAGHRVRMYAEGDESGYALWLDDSKLDPQTAGTIDLGGGAALTALEEGVEVAYGDGTIAQAVFHGNGFAHALDIIVAASDTFRSQAGGLLAPIAADSELPAMPDGSALPLSTDRATRYAQRYQQFGPAWHVTNETTMFDYESGQSTASFDVADFPSADVAFDINEFIARQTADQMALGQGQCVGVEDEKQFLKCIFDVLVTDDPAYAEYYAIIEQFLENGPTTLEEGPTVVITAPPPPTQSTGLPQGFLQVVQDVSLIKGSAVGPDGKLYVSYLKPDFAPAFLSFDTTSGSVANTLEVTGSGNVFFVDGSVWLAQDDPTGYNNCELLRLDPQTLTGETKLPIGCDLYSSPVGVADGIWWVDRSTADADGKGGMLRHVDPQTNKLDRAVELPYLNGFLRSSATTVFYGDSGADKGWYRLTPGATAFERMPLPDESFVLYPAGEGVWFQPAPNGITQSEADFVTTSATPDRVVLFDEGTLVAADESAVYTDQFGGGGADTLVRYPADGSTATTVLTGASMETANGSMEFGYFDDNPIVLGSGRIVKLWLVSEWPTKDTTSIVAQPGALP